MTAGRGAVGLVLALMWTTGATGVERGLTVSSAVSLKEPLGAMLEAHDAAGCPSGAAAINLGGSAMLAQQILRGAPVDVFVSASPREMTRLVEAGLVLAETVCTVAGNRLVVVVGPRQTPPSGLQDLAGAGVRAIAVANPRTAPLGHYTRQALEAAGIAARLSARTIPAEHARQVVEYLRRGEVDAAIVYATDAARFSDDLSIAFEIDAGLHDPILYQVASLAGSGARAACAVSFVELLCSENGRNHFVRHGFLPWSGTR